MSDENEEPYVEYLQPVFMCMMSALKVGLQPSFMAGAHRDELVATVKHFFHRTVSVALYITGSKMDQIMRTFYLFFGRMRVQFDVDDSLPSASSEEPEDSEKKEDDDDDTPAPGGLDSSSTSQESSSQSSDSEEEHKGHHSVTATSPVKHTDKGTLRNILVNTLYYYNCP